MFIAGFKFAAGVLAFVVVLLIVWALLWIVDGCLAEARREKETKKRIADKEGQ
jgi:hypothetical protein